MRQVLFVWWLAMATTTLISQPSIGKWTLFEQSFLHSDSVPDPFQVEFGAIWHHESGQSLSIPGFYNGNQTWMLRFCPALEGAWTFITYSTLPKLSGQEGSLRVTPSEEKGPIQVNPQNPQKFVYADGSPYFLTAFECDWLFALDAENPTDIPNTRKMVHHISENGFNQLVMNVFASDAN